MIVTLILDFSLKMVSIKCVNDSDFIIYSILNKLVRDILCIPISTIASELAFSTYSCILDDYRSSLKESVV
jgi:hAT family C-terminal dimerisation region